MRKSAFIVFFCLALVACAGGQPSAPQTPEHTLVYLYGLQSSVRGALADAIIAERVTKPRAAKIQQELNTIRQGLDLLQSQGSNDGARMAALRQSLMLLQMEVGR